MKTLGLSIVDVRDAYRERWAATHYTIAPAHDMPLNAFKFLLDEFAKRCVKETA